MSVQQIEADARRRSSDEVWVHTRDGVRLAVRDDHPDGALHTVVLLHGMCQTREVWARQRGYLRRRFGATVRLISPDHRGHGRSGSAPIGTYTVEQLGADLEDIVTALGVRGPVTVVTHSMGGFAALAYLARSPRGVEISGLVLVATAAGRLSERGLGRLLGLPAVTTLLSMVEHAPAFALKSLAGPVCSAVGRFCGYGQQQSVTLAAVAAEAMTTTPIRTIVGFLAALSRHDQYAALATITARTVVVSGSEDVLTPVAHALDLVAGIAGAKHVHVEGAGHMLPQEVPGVVNDAICWAMRLDDVEVPLAAEHVAPRVARGAAGRSALQYMRGGQDTAVRQRATATVVGQAIAQ